ncbi:hypothetical protein MRX96_013776 [Rhipicephalus microplus]
MEASPSAAGYTGARDMVMFGFDSKLDWLPTSFVNQFPEEKICSVCGLVPLGMHILSCGHWVCPECYCEVEKSQRCPLDKKTVVMKCFKRTTGSTKKLEKLKVRCWNAKYGCEVEGSVSEMLLHIKVMCRYHTIRCRRCHAVVLHRHIVPHLDSDCEGYRIAGEQSVRDEAADEIGATQAISKARFDPGAVRNTSAASKDIVLGSSSQHTCFNFCGRRCDTNGNSSEKKAKRRTLPESPAERCMSPSPSPSSGLRKECCQFTIENWASFRSHEARAKIRGGRCECHNSPSGYGFILAPSVVMNFLCFTVHAFRDSRHAIVPLPLEVHLHLRFVHPDGESSMDLTMMKKLVWDTRPLPLKKTSHQVHVARCRYFYVTIKRLLEGGFVADDALCIRYKLS